MDESKLKHKTNQTKTKPNLRLLTEPLLTEKINQSLPYLQRQRASYSIRVYHIMSCSYKKNIQSGAKYLHGMPKVASA